MKVVLTLVIIGVFWISPPAKADASLNDQLFQQFHTSVFFDYARALQEGNLPVIMSLMPVSQRENYRVLFEQNTTYSDYLKAHYLGSMLSLVSVRESGADYEGVIEVVWRDGRQATVPMMFDGAESRSRMSE